MRGPALATAIEDLVQVLIELKTPGSKFLKKAKLPKVLQSGPHKYQKPAV